jgi:predicted secreted protein
MANIVLGKNVNVEALIGSAYMVIGCAVSCAFEFENELIGKTDVNAGLYRKKRVRISDNRGSVNGLVTLENTATRLSAFYFLQEAIVRSEQTMRFVFTDEGGETKYITGTFLVQSISITADVSAFAEFDLSLEGTGGVEIGTVEPPPDVFCPELQSDTWETTEGGTSISGPGIGGKSYEGDEILVVFREGTQFDYTAGAPGNREYGYDGVNISFDPLNPFNLDERVNVVWKAFES